MAARKTKKPAKKVTKKPAKKKASKKPAKKATQKPATKKPAKKASKTSSEAEFAGFGKAALAFLKELDANNDRTWFKANQQRYEDSIREPARAFIRAMEKPLRKLSRHLVADDSKVGGSLMRVHRDTRFSKDKTPYKTNVGIQFRHAAGKDVHAPGLYLHLGLDGCFVGTGMWHPDSDSLKGIRASIDADGKKWTKVLEEPTFAKTWRLGGESLKRAPKGYDPEHPHIELLRLKDHILVTDLSKKQAGAKDLVETVMELAMIAKPHTKLLCQAIGQPF